MNDDTPRAPRPPLPARPRASPGEHRDERAGLGRRRTALVPAHDRREAHRPIAIEPRHRRRTRRAPVAGRTVRRRAVGAQRACGRSGGVDPTIRHPALHRRRGVRVSPAPYSRSRWRSRRPPAAISGRHPVRPPERSRPKPTCIPFSGSPGPGEPSATRRPRPRGVLPGDVTVTNCVAAGPRGVRRGRVDRVAEKGSSAMCARGPSGSGIDPPSRSRCLRGGPSNRRLRGGGESTKREVLQQN